MALAGNCSSDSENVIETWAKARQMGRFADVTFIVEYEDVKQVFHAHKCMLAFGSPVFEAMFYGPMQEKNNPIKIVDMNPAAFENLLRFLYAESIHLEDVTCAFDTYEAAERYDVPQLRTECDDYISRTVNNDSACAILTRAIIFNMSKAKYASLKFISKNAEILLLSEEFKNVTLDAVQNILQCSRLKISECKLLYAVAKWAVANKKNGLLKEHLKPLLKEIHFDKISAEDFCKFTDDYPDVLSTADALALMKHIQNPTYKKPDWCSSIFIREAIGEINLDVHENKGLISVFQMSSPVRSGIRSALNTVILAPTYNARSGFQGYKPVRFGIHSDLNIATLAPGCNATRAPQDNPVHYRNPLSMHVHSATSVAPTAAPEYIAARAPQGNPVHYLNYLSMPVDPAIAARAPQGNPVHYPSPSMPGPSQLSWDHNGRV